MITPEPKRIKLELMSNDIEAIIEELKRVPNDLFIFFNYDKLIKKLKEAEEK